MHRPAHILIRQIITLFGNQKTMRRALFRHLKVRLRRYLVESNLDNRPTRVREDQYLHMVALLERVDRSLSRGYVSQHALHRLVDVFLGNVIFKASQRWSRQKDRTPLFLTISPTGNCNLQCKGCYAAGAPGKHGSLDFATVDRIICEKQALWGSHFTVISGGEPFLWNDRGRGLLELAARHTTDFFMVYTNGTLINDRLASRLAELGNVSPAVSVEGFEEETDARRGKGVYNKILAAMETLRRHGVPFGISVTPTRHNWEVLTSDRFVDFFFEEQGALYGWLFQYMPIGRDQTVNLMVPPAERVEMLRRVQHIVRDKKVFYVDFWNSGVVSSGCICAGRSGGYFYIDWNGNIMPCVFIPYAVGNIKTVYGEGRDLNSILATPLFEKIRAWQDEYGFRQPAPLVKNWLRPCVIRDHFAFLKQAVMMTGATPINAEASEAIHDPQYEQGMLTYDEQVESRMRPIWEAEYAESSAELPK